MSDEAMIKGLLVDLNFKLSELTSKLFELSQRVEKLETEMLYTSREV